MAKTEENPTTTSYVLKAVIDIGSTSIRMVVAQVRADGSFQSLDTLNQSVAIGADAFTKGRIGRNTTEECVKVLRSFSRVLAEYGIDLRSGVRAVATSAVREARNRDEFLDRIYMATDINVEVIDGAEVNRLTFLGIRPVLKANPSLRTGSLLVAEVGGGSTEFLGLENGRVAFAHTYRLGAYRLRETMDAQQGSIARRRELLEMEIDSGIRPCRDAAGRETHNHTLLLMGGEARMAARLLLPEESGRGLPVLKISELAKLAACVLEADVEQVAGKYHIPFEEAQTLGTALLTYVRLAELLGLKEIRVCNSTLRDGLLAEAASGNAWTDDFVDQILNSVQAVGRRYKLDESHAKCVTNNAVSLFRALEKEHQLDYRYEVVLTVAALLHDVGVFVGTSSHHKHTQYIIENSDIFGMGKEDIKLAALVARYHRRALPRSSHPEYSGLSRGRRMAVNKLAAILRAVDALDRSHTQSVHVATVEVSDDLVVLVADANADLAAEKRALADKGKMFEQVYGRAIALRTKGKKR